MSEDYRKALAYFDEAIRLDPDYALAYAERSEAWTFIGDLTPARRRTAWPKARSDAEKAVAIGPNCRGGARGAGLGSVLLPNGNLRKALTRTEARKRTFASKSNRKRSAGAGIDLCRSNRRGREISSPGH